MLVLACMLALFSCDFKLPFGGSGDGGNTDGGNTDGGNQSVGVAAFNDAIAKTNASNVIVESVVNSELGELNSRYEIIYNNDGSATITYHYEKFNLIGEGAEGEIKSEYNGTVTRNADGSYSGDMGEVDLSGVTAGFKVDLSTLDVTINEAGDVLNATVAAANTEAVLGSAFSEDVALEVSIENGAVSQIELTFNSGSVTYTYD